MSELFQTQNEVTPDNCITYAQTLIGTIVKPVLWQGFHSYTLLSGSGYIIQFRSKDSPLDILVTTLAKEVYKHITPAIIYKGLMPNSSVSVWIIEALPGIRYLFTYSSLTVAKIDQIVIDLAK